MHITKETINNWYDNFTNGNLDDCRRAVRSMHKLDLIALLMDEQVKRKHLTFIYKALGGEV